MEQAQENREKFDLSLCMKGARRDLLHKFMKRGFFPNDNERQQLEDGEIELSLGLSMNGRFGLDPTRKKVRRSSSISNLVFTVGAAANNGSTHQSRAVAFEGHAPPLIRSCSLPAETEEELRRRKELQSMRRMEARKKRMEKLKNVKVVKDKENCLESGNGNGLKEVVNGSVNVQNNENTNGFENENGLLLPSPQGSIGSAGSGSSGVSETQSQHIDGTKQNAEVKSPSSIQSVPVQIEQKPGVKAAGTDANGAKEILKDAMFDMPYVSTKVGGTNGNQIDGFLYRYKKGEEVRIVCVCHGFFLSPAEFVKHGGGGDVENPLKHIVVNQSPLL